MVQGGIRQPADVGVREEGGGLAAEPGFEERVAATWSMMLRCARSRSCGGCGAAEESVGFGGGVALVEEMRVWG